jgi:hypothetical protein
MGKVTTGLDSVLYWAIESAFLNAGVGMPITATAVHQPFNPIEGKVSLPMGKYTTQETHTQESLDPNENLSFASAFEDGKGAFPNDKGSIYHDPMWMLALVFTKKVVSGTWAGGAGTYGKITGDFTARTHKDSVMIQYKTVDEDGTVVEEKTILGVKAAEYSLSFKKGDVLREKANLITANELDNSRAYSAVAAFDDGRWADWAKSTVYPAEDCVIYWDDSFAAQLVDIKIEEAEFIIKMEPEYLKTSDSLKSQYEHLTNREYTATIKGYVFGDTELDEFRLAYSSKTKKNLRLQWDTTASETKFLDFQNAYISNIEEIAIPAANEAYNVTLTFKAFGCDYEGNFNNLTDPDPRVTD